MGTNPLFEVSFAGFVAKSLVGGSLKAGARFLYISKISFSRINNIIKIDEIQQSE